MSISWWNTGVILPDIGGTIQTQSAGQPPRHRYSFSMCLINDSVAEWWSTIVTLSIWRLDKTNHDLNFYVIIIWTVRYYYWVNIQMKALLSIKNNVYQELISILLDYFWCSENMISLFKPRTDIWRMSQTSMLHDHFLP